MTEQEAWSQLQAWLKTGDYLPPELKDFHDQKLFFKWLVWKKMGDKTQDVYLKEINFVNLQVATIDYFLWFMAAFGYKLQRCRKKGIPFADLSAQMQDYDRELQEHFAKQFREMMDAGKAGASNE